MTQTMSTLRRDFVAGHLRSQVIALRSLLHYLERNADPDYGHVDNSLKAIEDSISRSRKLLN